MRRWGRRSEFREASSCTRSWLPSTGSRPLRHRTRSSRFGETESDKNNLDVTCSRIFPRKKNYKWILICFALFTFPCLNEAFLELVRKIRLDRWCFIQ
jgi:hypothetical protein